MTKEEAIKVLTDYDGYFIGHSSDEVNEALDMAISALKDIEKIQTIIDNYFTIGRKSGYECMGEIDRFLEPYKKGE